MRNKVQKTRCVKRSLPKFVELCKTYDKVQEAGAVYLSELDEVESIFCNTEEISVDDIIYTTDFLCKRTDGSYFVRECVFRKFLTKPKTIKLLDESQKFWVKRGITDWGIIIDSATETCGKGESNYDV